MGRGRVVTELMGQGVNGVTGDYSRGASGFWVEQGALAYPVHEITIAGNLREMLRNIVAVGTDVDTRAMQAYLDWEFGLVEQLQRDASHGFFVI